VERVRRRSKIARRRPDFAFDGELQDDAALVASGRPQGRSRAAGRANVLVFPILTAATSDTNWCSAWRVEAIGPILQGLARPVPTCRGARRQNV